MTDRPTDVTHEPGAAQPDAAAPGAAGSSAASSGAEAPAAPHEPGFLPHLRRTWRWWLLGLVCAAGLGVFMWAVDGRLNKPAPRPEGPAATPAEAVAKFLAAVDRHDAEAARSYAGDELDQHVDDWIDRAGYVRLVEARVQAAATAPEDAGVPGGAVGAGEPGSAAAGQPSGGPTAGVLSAVTLDVTYEAVTGFLDDDDPLGLNLAALVWTEEVEHRFVVTPAGDGWVVVDAGPPLRK